MSKYKIQGPINIPIVKKPAGRRIGDRKEFWKNHDKLKDSTGVYVFGMQAGGGIKPYYVGKASGKNKFEKECFHPHKLNKYNEALSEYLRGKPVMFFIVKDDGRGKANEKELEMIEEFFISVGLVRNEGLLNIKGTKGEKWYIPGVIRGAKGQPSQAAKSFKSMMGMRKK